VKVYFFAYEETIQEDALRLVAAKVAAALRVNGDTISDDSLADLDELTSGDLVATLAKIVVGLSPNGETQIEARSLQQAFAEANASLRQANTLIGEYSIVDGEEDEELETAVTDELFRQAPTHRLPKGPLPTTMWPIAGNGHVTRQPSLFSSNPVKPDGMTAVANLNGNTEKDEPEAPTLSDQAYLVHNQGNGAKPPIPRPRLLIG
jgi:hypothetical protein